MKDAVESEVDRLGIVPDYPPEKIRGVPLTPAQYDNFVRLSGKLAKLQIGQYLNLPQWGTLDDDSKRGHIMAAFNGSRESAANAVMAASLGSQNDIVSKATQAKMSRRQPLEQATS